MNVAKHFFAFLTLLALALPAAAQRDDSPEIPQNVVKINVGSIFLAHANIGYQRALGKHFSAQIAGLYGGLNLPIDVKQYIGFDIPYIKSVRYEGWGVVPTFRYYPLNVTTAPQGWYLEAFGQYREANIQNCVDKTIVSNPEQYTFTLKFKYTGIGLATGYQFMFGKNKNIVVDILAGVKYSTVSMRPGWNGTFALPPIPNPLEPGKYILTPEDSKTAENYVNNELVGKVNNQEIGLGFLSALDIARSALYIGYAF